MIAEEMLDQAYAARISDVPFSYALALRTDRVSASAFPSTDAYWQCPVELHDGAAERCAWPHALELRRTQQTGQRTLKPTWKMRQWTWQCHR